MLKFLKRSEDSVLMKGSFIVFIGSIIAGLGNYLFNILMGRMLGPQDFGILVALISLIYIVSVPSNAINLVSSRYVAQYEAKGQSGMIASFITKANQKSFLLGLATLVIFILISPLITKYLNLPSVWPVITLGPLLLITFIIPVNIGGLRGLQKFSKMSFNTVLSVVLKILIAVGLVYLAFGVNGALLAIALSALIANFYVYFSLGISKERPPLDIKLSQIFSYAKPVFLVSLCIAALYNMDVILAKHFLDPTEAGYYAVLSLLGKIIFFATGSIIVVMFPLAVNKHSQGKSHSQVLKNSIILILVISLIICGIYVLFPEHIVNLLFGTSYASVSVYLGWFGLVILLFSLINALAIYHLSIHRTDFLPILIIGTILEIVLLYLFHQDIWQIVWSMLLTMTLILASLIIFFKYKKYPPELKK